MQGASNVGSNASGNNRNNIFATFNTAIGFNDVESNAVNSGNPATSDRNVDGPNTQVNLTNPVNQPVLSNQRPIVASVSNTMDDANVVSQTASQA